MTWRIQGRDIPAELTGWLTDCRPLDEDQWATRLAADGYLFLRGALDAEAVLSARREVFERLHAVGEIAAPPHEGILTGASRRRDRAGDLGAFWKSVSEGTALRNITHGSATRDLVRRILATAVQPHDYLWLRPWAPGRMTSLHYDHPFFTRGSQRLHTVWIPLGAAPIEEGPLVVVERSHQFTDLIRPMHDRDREAAGSDEAAQSAAYQQQAADDPVAFVRERKCRFLSQAFQPGDIVIFTMNTMHGSLDNASRQQRVRLSCDVRYQPATDPFDERYIGANPAGAKGGGYGEMKAAKPLNEPW